MLIMFIGLVPKHMLIGKRTCLVDDVVGKYGTVVSDAKS
jgi:hypothetical protein